MPIVNTFGNASGRAYGLTAGGISKILVSSTPGPAAIVTTYSGYIVFRFNASATLNVGVGSPGTADVLLVRGGTTAPPWPGGGFGGGGGTGGLVNAVPGTTITANSPIPVVVGGTATNSTFGPLSSSSGSPGGSAGSGSDGPQFIAATPGGNGPTNNYLTGSPQNWAGGGGGGGSNNVQTAGTGGSLGGGNGGPGATNPRPFPQGGPFGNPGSPGAANTGGGGGGAGGGGVGGGGAGAGGSGVVIVRFPNVGFRTS